MGALPGETAVIHLTRTGVVTDPAGVERLREEFVRTQCVVLPQLLEPEFFGDVQGYLAAAEWYARADFTADGDEFAQEVAVRGTDLAIHVLLLRLNSARVFDAIRQITGCAAIGNFSGRIYRMLPDSEHYDSWHDDVGEHKLIGLSINLSAGIYDGGRFRLRERATERELCEVANLGFGDGQLFSISPALQHIVTPVTGAVPKTACAGWFRAEPSFRALLLGGSV
jgi:hypothetical protein